MKTFVLALVLTSSITAFAGFPQCAGSREPENCERIQALVDNRSAAKKAEIEKKIAANKAAAERFANRKANEKQQPRLGDTTDQVLKSTWGKPQRINRSGNAYGTHEQWVYGNGNYLYFDNGVLTSWQN